MSTLLAGIILAVIVTLIYVLTVMVVITIEKTLSSIEGMTRWPAMK